MAKVNYKKFDKAEKKLKQAVKTVEVLSKEPLNEKSKEMITKASFDIEKAEAEIDEADESSF